MCLQQAHPTIQLRASQFTTRIIAEASQPELQLEDVEMGSRNWFMAIVDRDDVVVSIDDWNKWKERLMAEAKEKCKRRRRDEELQQRVLASDNTLTGDDVPRGEVDWLEAIGAGEGDFNDEDWLVWGDILMQYAREKRDGRMLAESEINGMLPTQNVIQNAYNFVMARAPQLLVLVLLASVTGLVLKGSIKYGSDICLHSPAPSESIATGLLEHQYPGADLICPYVVNEPSPNGLDTSSIPTFDLEQEIQAIKYALLHPSTTEIIPIPDPQPMCSTVRPFVALYRNDPTTDLVHIPDTPLAGPDLSILLEADDASDGLHLNGSWLGILLHLVIFAQFWGMTAWVLGARLYLYYYEPIASWVDTLPEPWCRSMLVLDPILVPADIRVAILALIPCFWMMGKLYFEHGVPIGTLLFFV